MKLTVALLTSILFITARSASASAQTVNLSGNPSSPVPEFGGCPGAVADPSYGQDEGIHLQLIGVQNLGQPSEACTYGSITPDESMQPWSIPEAGEYVCGGPSQFTIYPLEKAPTALQTLTLCNYKGSVGGPNATKVSVPVALASGPAPGNTAWLHVVGNLPSPPF